MAAGLVTAGLVRRALRSPPDRRPRAEPARAGAPGRARATAATALAACCALGAGACGNTLQDQPVAPGILEPLVAQEQFPVYWLGASFQGLQITRVGRDPSGAYEIQYGNCVIGGESTCVTPLELVISPDNSFLPGATARPQRVPIRGVSALAESGGATLVVPAGAAVVDIYASGPALARAAAAAMVTINAPSAPGAPLPRPLPDTGFGQRPLNTQQPAAAPEGWWQALR